MRTKQTKAQQMRFIRLNKRILNMLTTSKHCQFLTITFTDETLNNTNAETRKRYVIAWLTKQCDQYVLNIDYGTTTEREHYHAIAQPRNERLNYKAFKYGFIHYEIIGALKRFKNANKDINKLAKRLSKHAFKTTTRQAKIIYSRPNNRYNKAYKSFMAFIDEELNEIYGSDETQNDLYEKS